MSKRIICESPDISAHQGIVSMKDIRESGHKNVWLRAGYGKNNVDQKYIPNAQACSNLVMSVGIYWFSYAYTVDMAKAEASYAVAQAAKFWKKCPIAFDFEYDSVNYARKNGVNITKNLATDMAITFLTKVAECGYVPILYTNNDYLNNYFDIKKIQEEVGTVYIWYARYTSILPESAAKIADMWQYTSTGRIPGVSGNVDLNKVYTDFLSLPIDSAENNVKCNLNILDFQKAANSDGYKDKNGNKLAEDGIDGTNTQYVRKQMLLKAQKTILSYKVGSSGSVVKWWQRRCNEILGHSQTVDGLYGKTSRQETIALQTKLGLAQDGIAGYNSIQAVFFN